MTDIVLKFNLLDKTAKKEVVDFIDFLLSRKTRKRKGGLSDYKKKILKVSTWSDSDIDQMIKNNKTFSQWTAQEW